MSEEYAVLRAPQGAVFLPTPEQAAAQRRGVVFYRLDAAVFPQAEAIAAVIGIYRLVTGAGPGKRVPDGTYEMRVGLRLRADERGHYWVGFNHLAFGLMFEQAFRALGQRRFRRPELPDGDPNRVLSIVDIKALEQRRAKLMSGGSAVPANAPASPEPVERMSPFERMRASRDAFGQTDFGRRLRRGMRGRRRGQADDQQ